MRQNRDGSFSADRDFALEYDGDRLNGAASLAIELSKPNSQFRHYTNTFMDDDICYGALRRWQTSDLKGQFTIERNQFREPAYYEVRAIALDSDGAPLGYASNPLVLKVTERN